MRSPLSPVTSLLLLLSLSLPAAPASAGQAPRIDVYTMGAGDELFTRFGHAAICVTDEKDPWGRCYNYGTADFSTPLPLTWSFVRGRALFWVSVIDLPRMMASYEHQDRTVWRQRLPLADEEARRLAALLESSTAESARYYHYHHFLDNCTTRLRDLLDRASGGRLRRDAERHEGPTFRDYARRGFAGDLPLLVVTELLLGRPADQRTSVWQAMFLPDVLRSEVAARLGAAPEVVYQRRAPLPASGTILLGQGALGGLGVLLSLWVLATRRLGPRAALSLPALALGLLGVVVWGLFALSTFPELVRNELLLLLWPTDLLLPFLGSWRRRYLQVRLACLGLCLLGILTGLLHQPLWAPLLLTTAPLLCALATQRSQGTSDKR